jgi:hypothetical protein
MGKNTKVATCPYSDTYDNLLSDNPILKNGQRVYDTTNRVWYIGDGYTEFALLSPDNNDLSNYYTMTEVDEIIDNIDVENVDLSNYYTMTEIDEIIDNIDVEKIDLSDYYTKTEVNTELKNKADDIHEHLIAEIKDDSGELLSTTLSSINNGLSTLSYTIENINIPTDTSDLTNGAGFVTEQYVQEYVSQNAPSDVYKKTDVDGLLSNKADEIHAHDNYADKNHTHQDLSEAIAGKADEIHAHDNYADKNHTHQDLSEAIASKADEIHTHEALESAINSKANNIHTHDTSDLTNDAGFVTEQYVQEYVSQYGTATITPEFVNSIEECTDTSKIYVLPDGYIYAYITKTETIRHVGENKFVASEATLNKRMGSSSLSDADGYVWTGAIPVDLSAETPFRIKVEGTKIIDCDEEYQKLWLCSDVEGTTKTEAIVLNYDFSGAGAGNYGVLLEDGTFYADYKNGKRIDDDTLNKIKSIRLGFKFSDSAITDVSKLNGVSITFPYEEHYETITSTGWYNTGHTFTDTNYEERIFELENRVTGIETSTSTKITIPSFWEDAVEACVSKIKAYQVDRNCITFPFFSDNHQRNGYVGVLIKKVMDECNIPYCFYGGDSISSGYIDSEATMIAQDKKFDDMMRAIPNGRFCRAVGNHDGYWAVSADEKYYYTGAENYELFLREESITQNKHFGGEGTYYYVEDISSKVRFVVLDTNDGNVEDEQLLWLKNTALSFNEGGWAVVFISHQPISNHYHANIGNAESVRTIVSNYINGSSANKASVVGWFSGHIHRDRIYTGVATNTTDDSIGEGMPFTQVTITSDHTGIAYDDSTKHEVANDDKSHAIDFVTINKSTGEVNLTRLGVGEDRSFQYQVMDDETEPPIDDSKIQYIQLTPEFANSIDECVDTSKIYVLPDGFIYAYMESQIDKNIFNYNECVIDYIDNAVAGYESGTLIYGGETIPSKETQKGVRLDSSGNVVTASGTNVSGFIPCESGDIIRLQGFTNVGYDSNRRLTFYNESKSKIDHIQSIESAESLVGNKDDVKFSNNSLIYLKVPKWQSENVRFFRFAGDTFDTKNNLVVTINHEDLSNTIITEYKWTNTGNSFVSADYSDEIKELETTVSEHGQKLVELEDIIENYTPESDGGLYAPEYMNSLQSLQDTGDISKLYLLPDGYIYAYAEASSDSENHYKNITKQSRIESNEGAIVSASNMESTDFISLRDDSGNLYKYVCLNNIPFSQSSDNCRSHRIVGYDKDKNYIKDVGVLLQGDGISNTSLATCDSSTGYLIKFELPNIVGLEHIRICYDSPTINLNDLSITLKHGDAKQWFNTGHRLMATRYEDRITSLEDGGVKEESITNIPDYTSIPAAELARKIHNHQNGSSITFAFLADSHCDSTKMYNEDILQAAQALKTIDSRCPIDFIVHGGDISPGGEDTTIDKTFDDVEKYTEIMMTYNAHIPAIWCIGNHDDAPYQATAERLTQTQTYTLFGRKNLRVGAVCNYGCNYGYVDFDNQRLRVIYLDTHDKRDWGSVDHVVVDGDSPDFLNVTNISKDQLDWLATKALDFSGKQNIDEWGILVVSHAPLNQESNSYTDPSKSSTWYWQNTINATLVLKAYEDKSQVTLNNKNDDKKILPNDYSVTYDFTALDKRAKVYCLVHGHKHAYLESKINGFTSIGCPNVSNGRERESSNGTTYYKNNIDNEYTSFCVLTIDRENENIYADCFGAGYDREISYREG